jgi:hypothetical protein
MAAMARDVKSFPRSILSKIRTWEADSRKRKIGYFSPGGKGLL